MLVAAVAAASALACSVYDSSLLGSNSGLNDNGGDMQNEPDAGGGTAATSDGGSSNAGGDVTTGGVTDVGGGGSDPGMPEAGETTGGAGGVSNTAGLGGMPATGGKAGAGGRGGTGGAVATGGSGGKGGSGGGSSGGSGGSGGMLHELAAGKTVTASTQQTGNEAALGNDGSMTTRWCATNGSFPQWWKVDLGVSHPLVQVLISFEHPDRTYYYLVETSTDDAVYTQQIMANGSGVTQKVPLPPGVTARYVRVTVTSAVPVSVNGNGTWASFWEFALQGY